MRIATVHNYLKFSIREHNDDSDTLVIAAIADDEVVDEAMCDNNPVAIGNAIHRLYEANKVEVEEIPEDLF